MKIKRFFAPDMRRAIHQVRTEHGPEAVILSSRAVEGGVEIVSALDYDQNLVSQIVGRTRSPASAGAQAEPAATATRAAEPDPLAATVPEPAAPAPAAMTMAADLEPPLLDPETRQRTELEPPAPTIEWSPDPALRAMQQDLQTMKSMLREQFAQLAWADLNTFQPERAALNRRVAALDLEPALAEALTADVGDLGDTAKAWREVIFGLARRVKVLTEDPLERGGVMALVGPTGVGKTTTIAKLAARHCLRHGADTMALISTDNYRVGAQRQLDAYGAILGVPVRRAESAESLARLVHELRDRKLVLIDTAGMAPRDCRVAEALNGLAQIPQVRTFAVLAANMQGSVMRDAVRNFGGSTLTGVVLTKLDEANGLGPALSVVIGENLPVAWLSEGQRVPEDLKVARPVHLINWAARVRDPEADAARVAAFEQARTEEVSCADA